MSVMQGSIRIIIRDGFAGLVATATSLDNSLSYSAISNAAGIISIPIGEYGAYRISYQDARVKGDDYAVVSNNTPVELTAQFNPLVTFTVRIDETNSNPATSCVYMDDAIGMEKGSSNWDSMPIFNEIRPCVFKNGQVQYYLNPNNFNQKIVINQETGA
jgi:hypothetical protein